MTPLPAVYSGEIPGLLFIVLSPGKTFILNIVVFHKIAK